MRIWQRLHRWSSLLSTVFLLWLCLTGLPLIFMPEVEQLLEGTRADMAAGPRADLDRMVADSRLRHPGEIVVSVFIDDDAPVVLVRMAPSWEAVKASPGSAHVVRFDAYSGRELAVAQAAEPRPLFLQWVRRMHIDLFAELPGRLLFCAMGVLLLMALVSGVVVYGPFMRKLDFGTVRKDRSPRLKWLDLHNLLGIATLAWALVVGVTGAFNELSSPLFTLWQRTDVQAMLAPWRGKPPPTDAQLASVQSALDKVQRTLPDMQVRSIVFPGSRIGSPHHYVLWTRGTTPLTSRMTLPVLVDARTGEVSAVARLPWYLRMLEVSRPLHFGDYAGLPLKILWALLDLLTIVVLGSGLYLWLARRRRRPPGAGQLQV